MKKKPCLPLQLIAASLLLPITPAILAAETPTTTDTASWQKPAWLTDLSLGVKEGYDDNILLVSGKGMPLQGSWISSISPKIGVNFVPLLGEQTLLQTLSLSYVPDYMFYHNAPEETYEAHKFNQSIKAKADDFSFSADNALLYNDGSDVAETYALNQLSGAAANQNDKYRNFYAQAPVRERRDQIQDRANITLQYDWNQFFIRPTASLLYYNLDTLWHNTGAAPYKGYQDYPSRSDVNGGADLGYHVTPNLALTVGYRYGYQYQQQFSPGINTDTNNASSDYQRVLLGVEGKPWNWLSVKIAGGPDFRDYIAKAAPVNDRQPVKYYGEAVMTATITPSQSVTFNYKQWQWVSSTGVVPYFDSTFALNYHWDATRQLSFDLGGKILEADYTSGNDWIGSSAPSARDDRQYTISAGVNYAFTRHLSTSLTYCYDIGDNVLGYLPASLQPSYREFDHQMVSLGVQYKF